MIINQKFKEIENKKQKSISINNGVIEIYEEQYYGKIKNIIKMLYNINQNLKEQMLLQDSELQGLTEDEKLYNEDYYHYINTIRLIEKLETYLNKKSFKEDNVIGVYWYEMTDSLELAKRITTLIDIIDIHTELLESLKTNRNYVEKCEIEENLEMDM